MDVNIPNVVAMDQLRTKCELHIPAKEPQSAAWPNRRSKHVETNNDNDDKMTMPIQVNVNCVHVGTK